MSQEEYMVEVGGDHLIFASGHFISYAGHQCERLHGHNYRATVKVHGPLMEDWYVIDFIALLHAAKSITDRLDHHMLLPASNPVILLEHDTPSIHVQYRDREWRFPSDDCIVLPIENTTAELLARFIGMELLDLLRLTHSFIPTTLEISVEEGVGVRATFIWNNAPN